mmetsp:Transcript_47511/g.75130  ORF Transcript_47511/g.75130 Transcript_47511/m.75130 type:complete len:141 (-) Transcript_47511:25-447(-)
MGCGALLGSGTRVRRQSIALLPETVKAIEELYDAMKAGSDPDKGLSRKMAEKFFKEKSGKFGVLAATAMFNEVDEDNSDDISKEEWVRFWKQVRNSGYDDAAIAEEIAELQKGGTWVDWKDDRDVVHHVNQKDVRKNSKQ